MAQVPATSYESTSLGDIAEFTIPFPFLSRAEVFVTVDGAQSAFTWINDGLIQLPEIPELGAVVRRYRSTAAYVPLHQFSQGVPFLPRYVDRDFTQTLYAVQESVNDTAGTSALALDTAELALDTAQDALALVGERTQYMVLGPYGPGLHFQTTSQVFSYDAGSGAEYYAPGPSITLPYTTTGVGAAEIANFRSVGDAILRQDLADAVNPAKGAALVGYKGRTVADRLGDTVSVKDFMAVGDGVADDTAAVQAAINAVPPGGVLYVNGLFAIGGTGTEIILIDKPMTIQGQGIGRSGFNILAGTSASTDVIRVSPDMGLSDGEGYFFYDFDIAPVAPLVGRHAINLDITAPGQRLKNVMIHRCRFEQLGGPSSIVTTNPLPNIDSVFTTTIRDSVIVGGIDFNNAGDSLRVENCTLTGLGWGVKFKLIPGANKPKVADCNITSKSGAVFVDGPTDPIIINNNIEALSLNDNPDSSFITITGTAPAPARNAQITGNIFGMLADSGVPRVLNAVVIKFADHTIIDKNQFNRGVPGSQLSYNISANARYTCVGTNNDGNATLETGYFDDGLDTRGTVRPLTPLAGYTEFTSFGNWDGTSYIKDPSGDVVTLAGAVTKTAGTWTDGVAFLTLPAGARPKLTKWFSCPALEANIGYATVPVKVDSAGNVSAFGVTGRTFTWVSLSGVAYPGYR